MFYSFEGPEPTNVQSYSEHLKRHYKHTRFTTEQEEWPPDQPKHFTSLAFIHYRGGHTVREVIAFAKAIQSTHVDDLTFSTYPQNNSLEESQDQVKTSKDIKEIFAPSKDACEPRCILIEGAPGIGKTFLSKEITSQWANGLLLVNEILVFLISLRDPLVQNIISVKDLVKYYYQFDESSDTIASSCAKHLLQSDGEHVTLVLDGYDEYPENQRWNGFIFNVLQRKVLPCCRVVITSRPHASAHLRISCDRYIEIRGFTKEDRLSYIVTSLKKTQDVDDLIQYLDNHLTISSLCFIPFNMTVLLWLYKQGVVLPSSSTELYNYFICHTIRHHLAKHGINLHEGFVDLSSLEEPYRQVIQQLSFLSYESLDKSKLTFTLEEIKSFCPQIDEIPGALNGFGLLHVVQHYGIRRNTTINFVHFSLQEFLAAYYVIHLPHYEEFCLLNKNFMSGFYTNTFTMYMGITKGQRPAFKQYLNGNSSWFAYMYRFIGDYLPLFMYNPIIEIRPGLLTNTRVCLHLFRCFHEADDEMLCREISKCKHFSEGTVSISDALLPSDIECLGIFLDSRAEWHRLCCYQCIDDVGFQILHQFLTNKAKSTCIREILIGSGSWSKTAGKLLTPSCSRLITEIVVACKTEVLEVSTPALLLEDVISLKDKLTELKFYVEDNQAAIITYMPILIHDNKTLKLLRLFGNKLSDDSVETLAKALKHNCVLEELRVPGIYHPADATWIRFKLKNENKNIEVLCTVSNS